MKAREIWFAEDSPEASSGDEAESNASTSPNN
jgi:hypothetical protein